MKKLIALFGLLALTACGEGRAKPPAGDCGNWRHMTFYRFDHFPPGYSIYTEDVCVLKDAPVSNPNN